MSSTQSCMPYDKNAETITEFLTRFSMQCSEELHKCRNNESKQVNLLMKALPVSVFTDVQRSFAPNSVVNATFEEVKDTLTNLYSTKKSILGSSVELYNCKQKPGQSIEEYARQLKYLSQQCGLDTQVSLSRIQRDLFLAGLNSSQVVTSILQTSEELTFDEAVIKAKAFTQLRQDACMLRQPIHHASSEGEAHRVQAASLPQSYVCIRCGQRAKHKAQHCYALKLQCKSCSKIGHIAKMCKSTKPSYKADVRHCVEYDTTSEDTTSHTIGLVQHGPTNGSSGFGSNTQSGTAPRSAANQRSGYLHSAHQPTLLANENASMNYSAVSVTTAAAPSSNSANLDNNKCNYSDYSTDVDNIESFLF